MDLVNSWAIKLAEEAAPDEVDLAPIIAEAFVKGGKDRKELFQSTKGGTLGAFGPGESLVIFPFILQGIAYAAPFLLSLLSSAWVNNLLSTVREALSLMEKFQHKPAEQLTVNPQYESLKHTITTISDTLRSSGISQDQADLLTYRVICAFLEDPQEALPFIQKVAEKK